MSSAPFDHRLVLERLRERVPVLQQLGTAADLGAVTALRDFRTPSAFVVLAQESVQPHPPGSAGGRLRQVAIVHFGVTLAVRNYRYDKGATAADELSPILAAVRDALIGWVPELPGARGCQLTQGRPLDYDAGILVWSDIYQTQHFIGGAP